MSHDLTTHGQYAKLVDVPPDLLRLLLDEGTFPSLAKRGPQYTVDPAALPDGAAIIDTARALYRRRLQEAIAAAQKVEHEREAVRLDLTDALENGTDPVDVLGADVTSVHLTRGPAHQALSDLTFAVLTVDALHDAMFEYDRSRRLTRRDQR